MKYQVHEVPTYWGFYLSNLLQMLSDHRTVNVEFFGNFSHSCMRIGFNDSLNCCCSSCLVVSNSLWPHGLQHGQAPLSFTISQSLLKLMSIESMKPSNHLILCRPFPLLPSIFPGSRVFSNELALHIRLPKILCFSFNKSLSNEYSRLISVMIDWFDLLAVQGSLGSSPGPQFESINSLVLSLFCGPTLTSVHDCWKNHRVLTIWTFVGRVMPLPFNMMSRFVRAFLPRSKCLLISWATLPPSFMRAAYRMAHMAHI